jgi:hypothetical protein
VPVPPDSDHPSGFKTPFSNEPLSRDSLLDKHDREKNTENMRNKEISKKHSLNILLPPLLD